MTDLSGLTQKQALFCLEYLKDLNATQAALRAGYSPKTAQRTGSENLSKPLIKDFIENEIAKRSKRLRANADSVLEELAKLAFADLSDVARWSGTTILLKDVDDLPPEVTSAISEISTGPKGSLRVKLHSKTQAIALLGRYLGMEDQRNNESARQELKKRIRSIRPEMAELRDKVLAERDDGSDE